MSGGSLACGGWVGGEDIEPCLGLTLLPLGMKLPLRCFDEEVRGRAGQFLLAPSSLRPV